MLLALTLGLTGSLGHCSGMCSGIVLLLNRALGGRTRRMAWFQIHFGRILAYSGLGFLAGLLGKGLSDLVEEVQLLQGAVAFYTALIGVYFVLVILGIAPSPEILFPGLVRRWRVAFQKMTGRGEGGSAPLLAVGFAWGLLPCGLTLTALLTAAITTTPWMAALRMAIFGIATLPMLVSVRRLSGLLRFGSWPRYGAAFALALFSLQIGLRGMAAYGFVEHLMVGQVMLW